MEMNVFANLVVEALNEKFEGQYKFGSQDILKLNGMNLRGIFVDVKEGATPILYIDKYLFDYRMGKKFDMIIDEIAKEYLGILDTQAKVTDTSFLNGDQAREKVTVKLINYDLNSEMLKTAPYRKVDDFALVPILDVDLGVSIGEVKFTKEQFETFGWNEQEILDEALARTQKKLPPMLNYISERAFGIEDGVNLLEAEVDEPITDALVLTNGTSCEGATALYYPGVIDRLVEILGDGFFIIPSSIHEVLIIPNSFSITTDLLTNTLLQVNSTMVEANEVLGTRALQYNAELGHFVC